jgi:hypothetical protein
MNSDQAVAMDMPPCDVLAVAMAEIGDPIHIDGESPNKDNCDQELGRIALKRLVRARHFLQIFQAAAQE